MKNNVRVIIGCVGEVQWLQVNEGQFCVPRVLCSPFRAMKVDRNIGPVPQSTFRATPQKSDMSMHVLFLRIVLQYYNIKSRYVIAEYVVLSCRPMTYAISRISSSSRFEAAPSSVCPLRKWLLLRNQ